MTDMQIAMNEAYAMTLMHKGNPNHPEFAEAKDCNPNPEPLETINADDDPAESKLHTISIGQHHISQIGNILHDRLPCLNSQLGMCNRYSDEVGSSYWNTRVKEVKHEIAEVKALIKMILGAESIDIHHHVNPLAEKE